jgi:hypothetical protein
VLSKHSTIIFYDQSKPEEFCIQWNQEAINQLQEVVDGLLKSTTESTSIEGVRAASEHGDTRACFDSKTLKLEYKYDAEFGSTQEEETRERATSTVVEIFECVKGMVLDSWIMHNEAEQQVERVVSNQSRLAVEPTRYQGGSITNPTEIGSQRIGPGVMMYVNVNNQGSGMLTYDPRVDPRVNSGIPTYDPRVDPRVNSGIPKYGGYDPRLNVHQPNEQQMTLTVLTELMKHITQDSERNAEYAQKRDDRESKQEDQKGTRIQLCSRSRDQQHSSDGSNQQHSSDGSNQQR